MTLAVLPVASASQAPAPRGGLQHPGTIVNAATGAPIEARAYAYSNRSATTGPPDCPVFDKEVSRDRSNPATGAFRFQIDPQVATYVALYCQDGYAYRVEDPNGNRRNGSRVQPAPITLLPLKQAAPRGVDLGIMQRAVDRLLELASHDLRYYSQADKDTFQTTLSKLSDADRAIAERLLARGTTAAAGNVAAGADPRPAAAGVSGSLAPAQDGSRSVRRSR